MFVSFTNTSKDDMALIEPFISPECSCFFSKLNGEAIEGNRSVRWMISNFLTG